MTRLRAIMLGVVGAFAAAGGLWLLVDSNATVAAGRACYALDGAPRINPMRRARWFVAVADAFDPGSPAGRSIDCGAPDQPCASVPDEYCVAWKISGAVSGWRLAVLDGHPQLGKLWRQYAEASGGGVRFAGGYKELMTQLVQTVTPAQARSLVQDVEPCWRRVDGQLCRSGRLYGPGLGGVLADGSPAACAPGVTDVPVPCDDGGRGLAWAEGAASEDWTEPQ